MNKKPDYSSLFYFNPLPSCVYDLDDYQILDVNEAAVNHYGYTKCEFLKLTIKNLCPEAEIQKMIDAHVSVNQHEGNIYFGIFTHQKKNGDLISMKINGHKLDYLDRNTMLVVCQDVTREEETIKTLQTSEAAFRESEARFRTIFEIATLGIAQVDPANGKVVLINSFYEKITGYSKEELLKMSFVELTHPDDRAKDWEVFTKAMRGEQEYRNVKRYIKKDGDIIWVRVHVSFIRDEQGKPIRTVAICEDVTLQKSEEQRLKLLESVVTNTNDAVLITEAEPFDEPGPRILYVNEAFTKMTGYTAEEVIGKTPRILQGPKSDKDELRRLGKALRNWESCEITVINYKKNGEEFWINFTVNPVANEKGWFTHWIAIERDVTEQKQKQIENELLAKINLDFAFNNDLNISLSKVCKTINQYGDFDFVELWLPNIENTQLRLAARNLHTTNAEVFADLSKEITTFKFGEGLPGNVWLKKTTVLWEEINKKDDFVRKEAAEKAKISAALGIPILISNNTIGVLVVATQLGAKYLEKHTYLFKRLEQIVGSEIYRKKLKHDLNHLYDSVPDIICIVDLKGRFLKINKAFSEITGFNESEILNETFDKFVHPDDKQISHEDLAKLNNGFKTHRFENRYITKSGKVIWLSWNSNSNLEDGLIYATAKNITEEKRLRDLNRISSKMARIGSWEIDLIENKIFWSDMLFELHETTKEEYSPNLESALELYREDFRPLVNEAITTCIEKGSTFDYEAVIRTFRQKERWVRAIGNAEFVDGKCVRLLGSFQDISKYKKLEQQKNSFITTIEKSLNEIYVFDADTYLFSYVNKGALLNIGYSIDEIEKMTPIDIKPDFTIKSFNRLVSPLLKKEEEKIIFFTNHKRKNGTLYPVEVHLQYISEDNDKRFLAIILDITERNKSEERLINAYSEKNKILESIGDAFFAVDKNFIVSYWNRKAEEILHLKRGLVIGKNLWDLFPDAVHLPSYKFYHEVLNTGKSITFEDFFGVWLEVNAYPSEDGITVFFRDITEKKLANQKVLQANERFEKVTEATNDAIWDYDITNNQLFWGKGFNTLFGYNPDEIQPTFELLISLIHEDDRSRIVSEVQRFMADTNLKDWYQEYRFLKSDASYAFVIDRATFIRNNKGKVIRVIGAMNDITERKNFEQQLLKLNESLKKHAHDLEITNEELEQFAFVASHDLQEPLRMVSSFMDQLKRKYENQLDDKALQYIQFATDGAKRMKRIILDLLEYSRAGKIIDATELVDLNEILENFQFLRRKIIIEKSVVIEIENSQNIRCFKVPLTQTLHCLLDNAIHYSKKDETPKISISLFEKQDFWEIEISDNGIGIEPQFHEKIFVIFQRLHNRERYEGTGIGLSIVKKNVESWGGTIRLESVLGEGSKFYITIPKNISDV